MKITLQFLIDKKVGDDYKAWCIENKLIGLKDIDFLQALIKADKLDWANWLIVKVMSYKRCVSYAVYAAESVLHIYEKEYPDDKRPREAIEAIMRCITVMRRIKSLHKNTVANEATYADNAQGYAARVAGYAAINKELQLKILNFGIQLLKKKKLSKAEMKNNPKILKIEK